MHQLSGRWIADLARSERHANHQFKAALLDIAVEGDRITFVHSGINMSGTFERGTTSVQADGEARPVSPQAPDMLVAARWTKPGTLESVATKQGIEAGRGTYELTDDDATLVATVAGTDAAGRPFAQRIVFGRGPAVDAFMDAAVDEAHAGLAEGGIPIGSVLVHRGAIIGRGHNRRVQQRSAILHGEMDALERAGRLPASVYAESVLYTTLSPCAMCTGAILLYGIPHVVVGENVTFMGEEALLRDRGVRVDLVQDPRCLEMMSAFTREHADLWNEDIGL
jgi:cytosine deaminase